MRSPQNWVSNNQAKENMDFDWSIDGHPYLFVLLRALVIDGTLRPLYL